MSKNKTVGIMYHEDLDGLTGAAVVLNYLETHDESWDAYLYGISSYQQDLPTLDELDASGIELLYVVDFCPDQGYLQNLVDNQIKVQVFDHHEQSASTTKKFGTYKADQSGCGIAWRQLLGIQDETSMPYPVRCVEDRDLWKFEIDGSDEVCAFLHTLPPDPLDLMPVVVNYDADHWLMLREHGRAVVRARTAMCAQMCKDAFFGKICDQDCIFVNTSAYRSEVGAFLSTEHPEKIAAIFWMVDDQTIKVSLRSVEGVRVNHIAKRFGGGGHPQAASFHISAEQFFDQLRKPKGICPK